MVEKNCSYFGIYFILFLFFSQAQAPVSHADSGQVWEAVCAQTDLTPMQEATHRMIKRLYGVDPAAFAFCALYYPQTNMGAEELFLVRLAYGQSGEDVLNAIEKRLKTQKTSFEGYGVEQTDLLTNHAVCESYAGFVLFVVSPAAENVRQAFRGAVGGG